MNQTRQFAYRLPSGEVREETRRRDQGDSHYAILATRDGTNWGLYRMTEREDEILRCVREILASGQSAYITKPWRAKQ